MPYFEWNQQRLFYRQQVPAAQFGGIVAKISDARLYLHYEGGHPLTWSAPSAFRAVSDYFLKAVIESLVEGA